MHIEYFTTESGYELEFWPEYHTVPPPFGTPISSRSGKTLCVKAYQYPPRGSTTMRVELVKKNND